MLVLSLSTLVPSCQTSCNLSVEVKYRQDNLTAHSSQPFIHLFLFYLSLLYIYSDIFHPPFHIVHIVHIFRIFRIFILRQTQTDMSWWWQGTPSHHPSVSFSRSSSVSSPHHPWPGRGRPVRSTTATGRCFRFVRTACVGLLNMGRKKRKRSRWRRSSSCSGSISNVCLVNQFPTTSAGNHYGNDSHYSEAIEDCIHFFNTSYRKTSCQKT